MNKHRRFDQRGAVSIFVVVFCALFVTIITVSFVSLMIRGQQQATNADLSNSAYDAALAGVEDAKRVVLQYRKCASNNFTPAGCGLLQSYFQTPTCNMVHRALTGLNEDDETLVKSENEPNSGSRSQQLDQAYTCVVIDYTSDEKVVQVGDGDSTLVPIDANGAPYNGVTISWFMKTRDSPANLTLPSSTFGVTLPTRDQWHTGGATSATPPILKAQWIQHGSTFSSADFDEDSATGESNVNSVFLYPATAGLNTALFSLVDDRSAASTQARTPTSVACNSTTYLSAGGYACSVNLPLPNPKNSGGTRTSYLNLSAFYNATRVSVKLTNNSNPVEIVAPTIDSTGRANDLFRRVKVGVSFTGDYPKANFDIGGNLCKDFGVTPDRVLLGTCDPNAPN